MTFTTWFHLTMLSLASLTLTAPLSLESLSRSSLDQTCLAGNASLATEICQRLQKLYPQHVYFPGSGNYQAETEAIWDLAAWKKPTCVFAPSDTHAMSIGLKQITDSKGMFTMRSGGHMPVVGYNSFGPGGIMIATTHFTRMELGPDDNPYRTSYLAAGAAFRWQDVYTYLGNRSLTCSGGRVGSVGSTLAIGGGLSYLAGQYGWVANGIVNFEVVLANGTIVNANEHHHPDLWWALKGGSSNFGIVTRYDIRTFPAGPIFGGSVTWSSNQTQQYLDAQAAFIAPGGGSSDPKAAIMPNFGYNPATKQNNSGTVLWYFANDERPKALENFTSIPYASGGAKVQPISEIVATTSGYAPRTHRWLFYNTAVISTPETMDLIYRQVQENAERLISDISEVEVGSAVQPVTTLHLEAAIKAGGDAMDLDPTRGDFVIALIYARYKDPAYDERLRNYVTSTISGIKDEATKKNMHYPFVFLNDAGLGQDPISSYGYGSSLPRLREVSERYDPYGVFQRDVPGFRLSIDRPAC